MGRCDRRWLQSNTSTCEFRQAGACTQLRGPLLNGRHTGSISKRRWTRCRGRCRCRRRRRRRRLRLQQGSFRTHLGYCCGRHAGNIVRAQHSKRRSRDGGRAFDGGNLPLVVLSTNDHPQFMHATLTQHTANAVRNVVLWGSGRELNRAIPMAHSCAQTNTMWADQSEGMLRP